MACRRYGSSKAACHTLGMAPQRGVVAAMERIPAFRRCFDAERRAPPAEGHARGAGSRGEQGVSGDRSDRGAAHAPLDRPGSWRPVFSVQPGDVVNCAFSGRKAGVTVPPGDIQRDPWAGSKDRASRASGSCRRHCRRSRVEEQPWLAEGRAPKASYPLHPQGVAGANTTRHVIRAGRIRLRPDGVGVPGCRNVPARSSIPPAHWPAARRQEDPCTARSGATSSPSRRSSTTR